MKENFADIIDYLSWRGDLSFDESPLSVVDCLIFCQLSYLSFDGLIDTDFSNSKTISSLYESFLNTEDYIVRCDLGAVLNPKTPDLLRECAKTRRFSDVKICGYKSILDEEKIEQFAAMTFIIGNKKSVVAYRGTDDTIMGWQEDFNLAFWDTVPAQLSGVEYLNCAAKALKGDFVVAGHSKGGNVALYSAVNCDKKIQKRLKMIYNFDGPGFTKEFFHEEKYLRIKEKICSFYPQFSIVGMFFEHPKEFEIVESNGFTVFQHDLFSWNVMANHFVYKDDFTDESKFFYVAFNDWLNSMTRQDRGKLTNVFFEVAYASDAKTIREIEENKIQSSAKMLSAIKDLNSEDKDKVLKLINLFIKIGKDNIPLLNVLDLKGMLKDEFHKIENTFDKYKERISYERNNRD